MQNRMRRNPKLWSKRPLFQGLINYAIGDVSPLLSLADKLTAELGKCQLQLLARLSLNYSQTVWLPVDKGKSKGSAHGLELASLLLFGRRLGLTLESSGSWLVPLFFIDAEDKATYRAYITPATSQGGVDKEPETRPSEDFNSDGTDFDSDEENASSENEEY